MVKLFLAFMIALLLLSCQFDQPQGSEAAQQQAGSLFIIGGGSRPPDLISRMIDEAGLKDGGYVLILPMSSSVPDSAIIWSSVQFTEQGIANVSGINFKPGEEPRQSALDSLENARLIFISGGDQNKFMSIVGGNAIEDAIHKAFRNGSMIAGTSAGAAVMSKLMITGNELRNPEYTATFRTIQSENLELSSGLGLIEDAIIDQHFIWRSRHNRLLTAIIEHPEKMGIGIDESTAILVRGNKAEVVGLAQVMVYTNPDSSFKEHQDRLGARNLRTDIYLPGESFIIK